MTGAAGFLLLVCGIFVLVAVVAGILLFVFLRIMAEYEDSQRRR